MKPTSSSVGVQAPSSGQRMIPRTISEMTTSFVKNSVSKSTARQRKARQYRLVPSHDL
jgi:hypothetical protein